MPTKPGGGVHSVYWESVGSTYGVGGAFGGFLFLSTFAGLYTDRLWYKDGGYSEVFSTLFWTKAGLFLAFGAVMGFVVGLNIYLAYRFRPFFRPTSPELLARPSGNLAEAEFRSRRGLSIELQATQTTRAFWTCCWPSLSA